MSAWRAALTRRLSAWKAAGLERRLRVAGGIGPRLTVEGRTVISFASNDYLGLSAHPEVLAAAQAALAESGAGATSSRLLCGTQPEHAELEGALARFKGAQGCLVFASGYHAALATLGALLDNESGAATSTVILDRLSHACLIDGAKLSGARLRSFKHNDTEDLRRLLEREAAPAGPNSKRVLVVVESLYSMDGDLAPLREIHALARASGAWLLVDEAHATGVLGPGGRGLLAECFGQGPLPEDILSLGTLSKALGSQGGFLCGPRVALDTIVHAGRAFLFSTGLAPAAAAAARAALGLIDEDRRRARLLERAAALRAELRALAGPRGWRILGGPGPILPIQIGAEAAAAALAQRLLEAGFWVPAVRYPTVRKGAARLRLSLSAAHSEAHVAGLLKALKAEG